MAGTDDWRFIKTIYRLKRTRMNAIFQFQFAVSIGWEGMA